MTDKLVDDTGIWKTENDVTDNTIKEDEAVIAARKRVEKIIYALKERYPEGSERPNSFELLKFKNQDLKLSMLWKWSKIAYGMGASELLLKEGLINRSNKDQSLRKKTNDMDSSLDDATSRDS